MTHKTTENRYSFELFNESSSLSSAPPTRALPRCRQQLACDDPLLQYRLLDLSGWRQRVLPDKAPQLRDFLGGQPLGTPGEQLIDGRRIAWIARQNDSRHHLAPLRIGHAQNTDL